MASAKAEDVCGRKTRIASACQRLYSATWGWSAARIGHPTEIQLESELDADIRENGQTAKSVASIYCSKSASERYPVIRRRPATPFSLANRARLRTKPS